MRGGALERGRRNQRHHQLVHGRRMRVVRAQLGADGDDRETAGQRAPDPLEHVGRPVHPPPSRAAAADIARPVLADAEHDRSPPAQRDRDQHDRVWVRTEDPQYVDVVESPPDVADGSDRATRTPRAGPPGSDSGGAGPARPRAEARTRACAPPSGATRPISTKRPRWGASAARNRAKARSARTVPFVRRYT